MQPLVSFLLLFLPNDLSAPSVAAWMARYRHVVSAAMFTGPMNLSLHRIEDAFIGLSCIAIAATLASFLTTADRSIPFRRSLIALTTCTTIAGILSLVSAAFSGGDVAALAAQAPLIGAVLAIFTACLLPFLLPLLLSKSRELKATSHLARQNETRFLAATQSSSDAFMLLDTLRAPDRSVDDFMFTYLNANAEKIIQLPSSKVVGARLTRILPIDRTDRLFQQFCQVLVTGKPLIHEFPLEPNDPAGPWMRHHVARLGEDDDFGLAITASDITERKHAELNIVPASDIQTQLRLASPASLQHDPLTGLPNHLLLDDRVQQAIARADRYRNRVALMLVDIDGFAKINETYGREIADQVLCVTGSRLRSTIRATDSVLRVADDEFVVLMPDMKLEIDMRRSAATLVAILREPILVHGKSIRIMCSAGVTAYPDTALTVPDLLAAAADARDRARLQGGNQYVLQTHFMEEEPEFESEPDEIVPDEGGLYEIGPGEIEPGEIGPDGEDEFHENYAD